MEKEKNYNEGRHGQYRIGGNKEKRGGILNWQLKYSQEDCQFFEECERGGLPVPEGWKNQPEMEFESREFLDGFYTLSNSRTLFPGGLGSNGSVGYIPLTEIESYCRMFNVEDAEIFTKIIRHLDRIYVAFQNEKLTRSEKSK